MLKQMTYREMSNFSNQISSELNRLWEDSKQFDLLWDRGTTIECQIRGNMFEDDIEDWQKHLWISSFTRNSIILDLIKSIDERLNFLVSADDYHGLGIIEDIVRCLPKQAFDHNYCSILISNYFKGDYFND